MGLDGSLNEVGNNTHYARGKLSVQLPSFHRHRIPTIGGTPDRDGYVTTGDRVARQHQTPSKSTVPFCAMTTHDLPVGGR